MCMHGTFTKCRLQGPCRSKALQPCRSEAAQSQGCHPGNPTHSHGNPTMQDRATKTEHLPFLGTVSEFAVHISLSSSFVGTATEEKPWTTWDILLSFFFFFPQLIGPVFPGLVELSLLMPGTLFVLTKSRQENPCFLLRVCLRRPVISSEFLQNYMSIKLTQLSYVKMINFLFFIYEKNQS